MQIDVCVSVVICGHLNHSFYLLACLLTMSVNGAPGTETSTSQCELSAGVGSNGAEQDERVSLAHCR